MLNIISGWVIEASKQELERQKQMSKDSPDRHQIGGDHYIKNTIQPWDAMRSWFPDEGYKYFLIGNAIKYLSRAGKKNNLFREDILKARHYLDKLLDELDE